MVSERKLREALEQLRDVLTKYEEKEEPKAADFLATVKAFEIAIEYSWRELKKIVEDEGLDAPSPKAAVRAGARLGIIKSPEKWMESINARNDSVHDYFGIPEKDYIKIIKEFVDLSHVLIE